MPISSSNLASCNLQILQYQGNYNDPNGSIIVAKTLLHFRNVVLFNIRK